MKFPDIKSEKDFNEHFQSPTWREAAREICLRHKIVFSRLERSASSDHVVFLVDDSLVLKIYRPARRCFEREKESLEFVNGKTTFKIPEIIEIGEIEGFDYVLMTQLSGITMMRGV